MKFQAVSVSLLLFGLSVVSTAMASDPAQVTLDFDDGAGLSEQLRAGGEVSLEAADGPEAGGEAAVAAGAAGRALKVSTEGDFSFFTLPGQVDFDAATADTIVLRIFNPEGAVQRFDFLALESDLRAIFWRKVEFDHQGWAKLELPMRWFRWNRGRAPLWERVAALGVRGGGGLEFWIDGIEVVDADPDRGAELKPEDLVEAMFPGDANAGNGTGVRMKTDDEVWLLTDSDEVDLDLLHGHLVSVRDKLMDVIPSWAEHDAVRPPMLLVAKDRAGYQAMFARLGEQLLATLPASDAGGYHVQGIAFSDYDPEQGSKRPVFTHEFTHSVASSIGRIDFAGRDWFQEGLASFVQLRAHPQSGIGMMILTSMRDDDARDPLDELTSGASIPMRRYWQAMTLVDFLMNSPEMKERYPELLARFDETGSTDLSRHLDEVYGMDFEALEARWSAWVRYNLPRYDPAMKAAE